MTELGSWTMKKARINRRQMSLTVFGVVCQPSKAHDSAGSMYRNGEDMRIQFQ